MEKRSQDPAEILAEALRLPASDRAGYLETACAGAPHLLEDLRSLLDMHERYPQALTLSPSSEAAPPARIGPYAVEREIGRGGMGVVYLGTDPKLGRHVAIKMLPEPLAERGDLQERFLREAQILAALNHPDIATIYSLEDSDGSPFLTMEYIEGETLVERLARGSLDPADAVSVASQIARALEAAHAKGIVHRDLKPGNVMILGEGRVKVLDFGLAVRLSDLGGEDGRGGMIAGTPGYMSPEQARGAEVDERSDLYALGRILQECLGKTEPPLSAEQDSGAFAMLRGLIESCVDEDPDARPASAADARRTLDSAHALLRLSMTEAAAPGDSPADIATNLRFPSNRFFGRSAELDRISAGLHEERLLTITGPGGCGKTRLAIEAARRLRRSFRDGIWFVDLGILPPSSDPAPAIEAALPWSGKPDAAPSASVVELLAGRESLVILDNCEHLLHACGTLVAELLRSPGVRFLVTSREPLRIRDEVVLRLATLPVPGAPSAHPIRDAAEVESVALLVDRIRRFDPEFVLDPVQFDAVCTICRALDGLPLALELSAARIASLSAREVEARLAGRLSFFRDPSRPREAHRTLQSLVDWSYGMLSAEEQALLKALSLLRGGWTLAAAEAMAASAGIEGWRVFELHAALLEKSLVESDVIGRVPGDPARYRMLETIREYAEEKLGLSRLRGSARTALITHHARLAEEAEPRLTGPDQEAWLRRLRREHENLCAALDAAEEEPEDASGALRIAAGIGRFWLTEGRWSEGMDRLRRWLDRPLPGVDPALIGRASHWAANLAERAGALDAAESYARRSLSIWEDLGRRSDEARILQNLGNLAYRRRDPGRAIELYRSALSIHRSLGEDLDISHTLNNLGSVQAATGDFAAARASLEESLVVKKRIEDHAGVASTLQNLGALAGLQGDLPAAAAYLSESERICRRLGAQASLGLALGNLALVQRMRGDLVACRAGAREACEICVAIGDDQAACSVIEVIAMADAQQGWPERAATLFGFVRSFGAAERAASAFEDAGEVDAAIAAARAVLGEDGFAAAWAHGQGMTLHEAAAYARERDEGSSGGLSLGVPE